MGYLHGVETQEGNELKMTIDDAETSSVVILGTSLITNDDYVKITNFTESAKYVGNNIDGLTLADAVETVLTESGGADIYPINIFNPVKHLSTVTKDITFTNGVYNFTEIGVQDLTVKKGEDELTLDEDYAFEGNSITVLAGGEIETNQTGVTATYKYFDKAKITDADVVGTTDENGKRTGLQQVYDIAAEFGVIPGIIIAPGFTSIIVRNALETIAEKLRGFTYPDAPRGTTIEQAERARFKETNGLDLTSTSEYSMLALPHVKRFNSYQNTRTLKPLSPVLAGLRVRLDRERNVGKSIDNTASNTILGTEYPIYFKLNQEGTDSNRLNALGLATVINYKGQYRIWGARNSSYPSKSGIMTFESARRTRNFIHESIENATFYCVGENITRGFIDDVLNAINSWFAKHSNPLDRNNQIMYSGEAYWDENLNSAEDIANGHIQFPYEWCPLAVAERITYKDILNITIITKALNS